MKILLKNMKGQKSTKADPDRDLVHCIHCSAHKNTLNEGERYQCHWIIDFADLTDAEVLEAAAEYFIIAIRRKMAACDAVLDFDFGDGKVFMAKDFVSRRVTEFEKLAERLAQISEEQVQELLKMYQPEKSPEIEEAPEVEE